MQPVRRSTAAHGAMFALAVAAVALAALGGLGVREDLATAWLSFIFWVKLGFTALLAALAWLALRRSRQPGVSISQPLALIAGVVALTWIAATVTLQRAAPGAAQTQLWGMTWRECPIYIGLIGLCMLPAGLWWLRQFGPVTPRLSGALVGLVCGAVAAVLYALHCRESGLAFLGVWYLAGMAIPAGAGAVLGRKALAW